MLDVVVSLPLFNAHPWACRREATNDEGLRSKESPYECESDFLWHTTHWNASRETYDDLAPNLCCSCVLK